MVQALAFVGYHNSGKTTLIRKVAQILRQRGYEIAIIKSTKHELKPLDTPGSDTSLYVSDGVENWAVVTPSSTICVKPNSGQGPWALAVSLFPHVDLVLCEGFKHAKDIKKIEVARSSISENLLKDETNGVIAVVSDFEVEGIRRFDFQEVERLCDFIEETLQLPEKMKQDEIHLLVNGRKIPMKRFVRDSLKGTICGYVASLRFTENAKDIEILIRLKK
ncbi:MAG: molybdopterin-guanine dinucleotide biosynthesis protein B [Thermodesulfobacteria bacterium]|nr:molybdopterin-guanine dinucleotide biosynthesis protein B [Thermodesulfobacteriota bacterium]